MARTKGANQVSEERKIAILDLADVGIWQHVIVKDYSMLQSTASIIIRRQNDHNNEHEEIRGRKRKLTAGCIRALLKYKKRILLSLYVSLLHNSMNSDQYRSAFQRYREFIQRTTSRTT